MLLSYSSSAPPRLVNERPKPPPWTPWSVEGNQSLIVLLVEFSDVKHSVSPEPLLGKIEATNQYFKRISYGKISLNYTLVSSWKSLNNTMSYYGEDDPKAINSTSINLKDLRKREFLHDSIQVWDSEVDFTSYEHLIVIHAGEEQSYPRANNNITELLWRQGFFSYGHKEKEIFLPQDGGALYWGYSYVSEFAEFGLIAHEFAHSLGLPDLYDRERKKTFLGQLSLMDSGDSLNSGKTPSDLEAWSKIKVGWLTPTEVKPTSQGARYELFRIEAENKANVIKIPKSDSTYYLIESRWDRNFNYSSEVIVLVTFINETKNTAEGIVETKAVLVYEGFYDLKDLPFSIRVISLSAPAVQLNIFKGTVFLIARLVEELYGIQLHITGTIQAVDENNETIPQLQISVLVDGDLFGKVMTNDKGEATVDIPFGITKLGSHLISFDLPDGRVSRQTLFSTFIIYPAWPIVLIPVLVIIVYILTRRYRT